MPSKDEIEAVVGKLTEAQRAYLTFKTRPSKFLPGVLVSYPPSNVHRVLQRRGLQEAWGEITPLGLAVRTYLQARNEGGDREQG